MQRKESAMKIAGWTIVSIILALIYGILYFMSDEAGRKALSYPFKVVLGWIKLASAFVSEKVAEKRANKVERLNPAWPKYVLAIVGVVILVLAYFAIGGLYRLGGLALHSFIPSSIEGPYSVPSDAMPGIGSMFTNYGTIQKTAEDDTNWQIIPQKHWWGVSFKYYKVDNDRLSYAGRMWLYNGGKYYTSDGVKTFVAEENNWYFK